LADPTDRSVRGIGWPLRRWLVWSLPAFAVLALAFWLQAQAPQRELFLTLNHWAARYPTSLWSFLTLLGEADILFVLLSPLLLWRPQAMVAVVAAVPVGGLFSVVFKRLYEAPRPAAVLEIAQFQVIGPLLHNGSFPSGHTISAFAGAGAVLATLFVQASSASKPRSSNAGTFSVGAWAGFVAVVILAMAIGFSRVAVGAHWPVDVLAGAGGGWLAGLSGAWVAGRFPVVWQSVRNQRVLGGLLCATGLWLLWHPTDFPQGVLVVWLAAGFGVLTAVLQLKRPVVPVNIE
jgi:membrane-associated phospholipid phosphatase